MSLPETRRRGVAWRSVAAALLCLLLATVFAPFATAQGGDSSLPACCRDARSCNQHLHHAAEAAKSGYHFAAVQPRCPCTPLAPASATAHGAAVAASTQTGVVLEAQSARGLQHAAFYRRMHDSAGGTRGPPACSRLA